MSTKSATMKYLESLTGKELSLGELLRSIRLCDEMSLVEFSKKLKITVSHLCDIEKGRKIVSPERAARFARQLGRSEEQFVRLSLQQILDQAGLKMMVNVTTVFIPTNRKKNRGSLKTSRRSQSL